MSLTQWQGTEVPKSQIDSITIGGTPTVDDVYNILIGGIIVCTYTALTSPTATTVRDGLRAAWDLATGTAKLNPYSLLLTSADKSTDALTLTTTVKGWPFTITVSKTGVGTITQATDTAPLGPNFVDHAENWSNGLPVNDSDVVVANVAIDMCWGLETLSAVTCATLKIKKSFTGRIGLRRDAFAITANGRTMNANAMEYRKLYWKIGADILEIGAGSGVGSDRIKLWQSEGSPDGDTFIKGTASASADVGLPAIRLRGDAVDLHVDSAIGGVGLSVEEPAYSSTTEELYELTDVFVNDVSLQTSVICGPKTWIKGKWTQYGGTNKIRSHTTDVISISFDFIGWGGTAEFLPANYTVDVCECRGAVIIDKHRVVHQYKEVQVVVSGTIEIGDIFEIYITAPQWFDKTIFGAGLGEEALGYALLAKVSASSTSENTTATQLEDAIQEVIDNGPLADLFVGSLIGTVTIRSLVNDVPIDFTIKVRTTESDGGAADAQTFVASVTQVGQRHSINTLKMYSGVYDATQYSNDRYIGHIEFLGDGIVKWNKNTHIDRVTGRREMVGI